MKKLLTHLAVGSGLLVASYSGFKAGQKSAPKIGLVKQIQSTGKRYVAFNTHDFLKKPGVKTLSFGDSMPLINGVVLKEKPQVDFGPDWVVQEEYIYHTMQIKGCEYSPPMPTPCPTEPTPEPCGNGDCTSPTPTPPLPTPTPPVASQEFLWWSKQVGADLAQSKVDTSSVTVCVLDTGVDKSHVELIGMIAGGSSMLGGDYQDDQGHGTHVAGIIAAKNGNGGISGVSQAKVFMVKVLDRDGSGMSSWIANGIVDCVNRGYTILSMSLGSDYPDSLIKQAVDYATSKGAVIIAAAGNNGGNVGYPAGYPNVVAVSAVDQSGKLASFSSRGSEIDFAGYGVNILSLKLGGGTVSYSGTSMATPGVAAVFAFAKKLNKNVVAKDLGLSTNYQGKGLAHAGDTVQ